jgi:hypothetical protein
MLRFASPLSAVALVGATVALAACGGGGSSSSAGAAASTGTGTATTPGAPGGTQTAALQKFTQCLKDNGVTLPQRGAGGGAGPGGYGGGFRRPGNGGGASSTTPGGGTGTTRTRPPGGGGFRNNPKLQKAMQACAKLRPQGAGGFGGRAGGAGRGGAQQSIKAFTPYLNCLKDKGLAVKVSDGFNALRDLKRDDPKVQAALKSCQSKIPQRPQGAPGQAAPSTTAGAQS